MAFKDFLRGAGSVLSLYPAEREDARVTLPEASDEAALRSDWEAVGNDLRFALNNYDHEKK